MRAQSVFASVSFAVLGLAIGGCPSAHGAETDSGPAIDGGPIGYDVGPVLDGGSPVPCGPTACAAGMVCCNASCGICTPPGGTCSALACLDAGPPPPQSCGGFGGATCPAGQFCDYPLSEMCGAADGTGICQPIPDLCADPGGVPVCGCDGHDYLSSCLANAAGTSVRSLGTCAMPQQTPGVTATRSCGPADGPAWRFVVAPEPVSCTPSPTQPSITVDVWAPLDGLVPGTRFRVGTDPTFDGSVTACPGGGGPPCVMLSGTITFQQFVADSVALFSLDLVAPDGTPATTPLLAVEMWCPSMIICG
jgi:hypothetical protein